MVVEEHVESAEAEAITTLAIGPEELPDVVDRLLGICARRADYDGLDDGVKAAALIGELFVEPHEKRALEELAQWLRQREIPFAHTIERGGDDARP